MDIRHSLRKLIVRLAMVAMVLVTLGLPSIQASHVARAATNQVTQADIVRCTTRSVYTMVWDGWRGSLSLRQGGVGTLAQDGGNTPYQVRYQTQLVSNPQDTVDGMHGPGYLGVASTLSHRITFWVDFANTPNNPGDDQRFDGYVMSQTKDAFAGVTWWQSIPFGFYATFSMCAPD
jgi:hypothetical protein